MQTILVIDDNRAVGTALEMLFSLNGLSVACATSPEEGLSYLEQHAVDLVIQDMNFSRDTTSGEEGVELFHRIRRHRPELPVILLTAWTHLETAVGLVKAGAADYLAKPWDDDKLLVTARNLLRLRELEGEREQRAAERRRRREELAHRAELCGLVYESEAMHELASIAVQIARSDLPVLLSGANGAGKEKLADIVHANSSCRDGPYVKVNVGALPAELLESELFGAEAGAYTGADRPRPGRFEAADGGTLLLDEIGNLSPAGQAKLLRVLQSGEFERLGSNRTRRVRVRVMSATNADLPAAVEAGAFREDLYYRLNVIELHVPALAERPDDILPLALHFLPDGRHLAATARRALLDYPWPGNVRELRNVVRRASLLAAGEEILPGDLRLELPRGTGAAGEPGRSEIEAALARADGVVAQAARKLGLSRQALYRRMEKYGIKP